MHNSGTSLRGGVDDIIIGGGGAHQ